MIRSLGHFTRKQSVLLGVYYAHMLEYRAEIYLWALSHTLPFILMGVWTTAAQRGEYTLSPQQLGTYFMAIFIVRQYTVVWVAWEFEHHVLHGRLSPLLLQPIDPAWRFVAMHLGEKIARTPFVVLIVGLVLWLAPIARWRPDLQHVLLTAVAIMGASALRFLIQYTSAMLAFWTERASSIEDLMMLPYLFLSGFIAPLSLYPEPVRVVAFWTPFPYLLHFPAQLLLGRIEGAEKAFAVMLAWAVAIYILNRSLWRLGLRHYSAMGA